MNNSNLISKSFGEHRYPLFRKSHTPYTPYCYSSFLKLMRNSVPYSTGNSYPHTPMNQVASGDLDEWLCFQRGIACRIHRKCLIYSILNTRVTTQTLLGFVIKRSLWDEGISNDPNGSCRKTSHDILILNTGGSNGYIS